MAFYESIAQWYEHIFPVSQAKIDFVKSHLSSPSPLVTETGCATGEFATRLAEHSIKVFAFDLDSEMVHLFQQDEAYERLNNQGLLEASTLNMLKLADEPRAKGSDMVCCFGNTLVHLPGMEEIKAYFQAAHTTLKEGGIFTGQIVNYDRIIQTQATGLPTIDNEHIRFERTYSLDSGTDWNGNSNEEEPVKFHFSTILTIKRTNHRIENSIPLIALKKATLEAALKETGFTDIAFYGNYKKATWSMESGPTIFVATKR
jgi:hypothetical protein